MARTAIRKANAKKTTPADPEITAIEREEDAKKSAPVTVKLTRAASFTSGKRLFIKKGGTVTLSREAADGLLETGLFEEIAE